MTPEDLALLAGEAAGYLQTFPDRLVAAAARGDLDLTALARQELASRGLNHEARWVGFPEAARIAKLSPVRGADGARVWVSIPEDDQ